MVQNTPKHRLRYIGDNCVCSFEHILRKFDTPKQCIRPRNTRFATFFMQTVAKCSKTLPNIVWGLLETIGCVRANLIYGSSVPWNSAFGLETPILQLFSCKRQRNARKHYQTSFEVYWRQLGVFVWTYFTEVRYAETVHSPPKHPFCNFFHADNSEMLQNTPKHRLRSIGDNWVCLCEHSLRKFGTPKQCIRLRYTRFTTSFMQIIAKCYKTLPNIVWGLLETIACVRANIFYGSLVPRTSALGPYTPVLQLISCS